MNHNSMPDLAIHMFSLQRPMGEMPIMQGRQQHQPACQKVVLETIESIYEAGSSRTAQVGLKRTSSQMHA